MPIAPIPPDDVRPRVAPEPPSFSLFDLIEEIAALIIVKARDKGLEFRRFVADDVPALLSGGPEPLSRVLSTLLGNAVRFTEHGEVRLDVRVESAEVPPEAGLLLRFTIIDTGIGLERGTRDRVFEGASLALCRQIVRLMGGDIHAYGLPGEGAAFWFTARFAPAEAGLTALPPIRAPASRPLRILIAEDNVVNQHVLAEQLDSLGHISFTVSNGREALEAIGSSLPWDAVLLDCQMPVMDGYEAVAAIRQREAAGAPRTWVVAVTANALQGDREACLRAGMDDFLSKPFHIRQLTEVLSRILPRTGAHPREPVDASKLDALAKPRQGGEENRLDNMVRLFTESGAEMLDQMEVALARGDFTSVGGLAHKLGGGCMYLGATDLHRLCTEAQRLGRLGDHEALRSIVPRIRQEYQRVEQALRRHRPFC
jgi:CheY-like chemotaxis protein/HPt (histidine-containing phosphotransfer) domain-containing protein